MTLNSKVAQLPSEQASWLLLIKGIFKNSGTIEREDKIRLIDIVEMRAKDRGYTEICKLLNTDDFEEYFGNEHN